MKSTAALSGTLGAMVALSYGTPALAHHSFAMFDRKTEVVLTGTVKEFQWQNPHTYIQLISDKDGQNWSIEAGGLNGLIRDKWRRDSLLPGERISVHVHPLRNGAAGAEMMWVQKADGSKLGDMAQDPSAAKPAEPAKPATP